ncbi:hypothetical protein [Azospirillum sp.]|uniref:hypothetical protein n=1 Tax=Azospirillum sp. TaxID=34012 RepID=UPI002D55EF33|nr:hypothetical protein [Azospirillum sp.]HYD66145.1 hypothetical protein [Azospirillum sp.]
MTITRRRFKQSTSFQDRLAEEAKRFREEADKLPHGPQKELYLRRARQCETASHINDWLTSPGLQPPTGLSNHADN